MILADRLAERFNLILGDDYKLYPFHTFYQNNTKDKINAVGNYDINYQVFEENAKTIIGTVTATEIDLVATSYVARNYNYNLSVYVPLDDDNNINFFSDYFRLYTAVNDNQITFIKDNEEETYYKAYLTMSEPTFLGKENTGSYKRAVYQITGNVAIRDSFVGIGDSVKISLMIDGVEHYFNDISETTISSSTDSNAVQLSSKIGTEQDVSIKAQTVTFAVADILVNSDNTPNKAIELVRDKTFKNIEILSPTETDKSKKRKVKARLYKDDVLMIEFYAIMSTEYSVSDKISFGVYRVGLSNDEKGV